MKKGEFQHYRGDARFSGCGKHRFALVRCWNWATIRNDIYHEVTNGLEFILWVCLNPSIAGSHNDDPTVKNIASFTDKNGFSAFALVNLFSFISTKTNGLWSSSERERHSVINQMYIEALADRAAKVVVAWGGDPKAQVQATAALGWLLGRPTVSEVYCLGKVEGGAPRHPSRLGYDTPWELFAAKPRRVVFSGKQQDER